MVPFVPTVFVCALLVVSCLASAQPATARFHATHACMNTGILFAQLRICVKRADDVQVSAQLCA
jgi:hypothetical protein